MEPTTELVVAPTATEDQRHGHNDESPIHNLPPELLRDVFKYGHRKRGYRGLFAIRFVCKYWLEVVDSSPELWTFVSVAHNEDLLNMILHKSKNNLLSIEYDDGTQWSVRNGVSSERITRFRERIIPFVERWKSLHCLVSPDADHNQILSLQFQSLETLKVYADALPSISIKSLHAPKLREVDLLGFSVNWGLLSNLRVFMVTACTSGPAIDEVYLLLDRCPKLETFKLYGCIASPPNDRMRDLASAAPVFLPHLQHLLLFDITVTPYSSLLPLINAPNLRRLFFYQDLDPYESYRDTMFQPVERFFGSYAHSFNNDRGNPWLRISCSTHHFTVSVGACKMVFHHPFGWTFNGRQDDHLLTELAAALSTFDRRVSDNIKAIHLGGTRSREDLIILGPILQRHFPNVEELVVTLSSSKSEPDAHLVLEALTSPLPSWGETRWLFPRLNTLRLKACREARCDGVIGVIGARRDGGVQVIQRVSIKKGRIGRDTVAKLKASLQEFCTTGTRYLDVRRGKAPRSGPSQSQPSPPSATSGIERFVIVKLPMEQLAHSFSRLSAMENGATLGTTILERRSHNELLPLHRLPPELFYIIIENAYTEVSYELLFALRSVCKYWMEIVDSMPQLWAQIALYHNANLLSMILQKSTTQPLDVWCREGECYSWGCGPTFQERVAGFLEHVGPSAARWQSLHYMAPTNTQHERMLSLPLHNLETLDVNILGPAIDYTGIFDAPRLRNLDVSRLSLNWRSLSNLRSFQIDSCVPSPTVDEVYVLLKSSPDLELFKIARNWSSPTGHTTDLSEAHSAQIPLPRLRTLLIVEVPFVSHSRLLDLVEAPNLHRFAVFQRLHYLSDDFTPMFESAGRLVGALRHPSDKDDPSRLTIAGAADTLAVVLGNRRVGIKKSAWTQGNSQHERPASLSTVLRQFDARLCGSVKTVRFSGIGDGQEMLDLAQILNRRLCNVGDLEVSLTTSTLEGLSILSRLSSLPVEGREAWLFPKLIGLQIDAPKGMECDGILEVVKARWDVGQVQAIRRLTIEGGKIRRESVDELKTHLQALNMTGTEVA